MTQETKALDPLAKDLTDFLVAETQVSGDKATTIVDQILDRIQAAAGSPKGFLIETFDPVDSSRMSWISDERAGAERNVHERPGVMVTPLYPGRSIAPFVAAMSRPLPMTERGELEGRIAELERRLSIATDVATQTGDPRRCIAEIPWAMPATAHDDADPLFGEIVLLDEVLGFYADDEDRHLDGGEAFGSIPTEVGMKARQARERHRQRAFQAASAGADQNRGIG